MTYIDENARVHSSVVLGSDCSVWSFSKIRENVTLGDNVTIGQGVYIGPGVRIGNNVKIQNGAQIFEPSIIEDGVFIGPGTIFTNDKNPRAVNIDMTSKQEGDWSKVGVSVMTGASIGAGVICVAPLVIGTWSMVGAGSLVLKDVPDGQLVFGSPARVISEIDKLGFRIS